MENIVWSMEMCIACEEVKDILKNNNIEFEERPCKDLVSGQETNLKAVRFFVKQNHAAPIVLLDGCFYNYTDIKEKYKSE